MSSIDFKYPNLLKRANEMTVPACRAFGHEMEKSFS